MFSIENPENPSRGFDFVWYSIFIPSQNKSEIFPNAGNNFLHQDAGDLDTASAGAGEAKLYRFPFVFPQATPTASGVCRTAHTISKDSRQWKFGRKQLSLHK